MWPNSLAFRLFLTAAVWSLVVLVIAGTVLNALYRNNARANFEALVEVSLLNLISVVQVDEDGRIIEDIALGDARFGEYLSGWYWRVSSSSAPDAIRSSPSLQNDPLEMPTVADLPHGEGFRRLAVIDDSMGHSVLAIEQVVAIDDRGTRITALATGNLEELEQDIANFRSRLILVLAVFGIGLVATTVLVVTFGLRPLDRVREGLRRIRAGDSGVLDGRFPTEIAPLVTELNALIEANRKVTERARTQVGNLAHGLKTPLSVLMNESGRAAEVPADKVAEQAAAMRHQIDYYLDRARIAAGGNVIGVAADVAPILETLGRVIPRMHANRDIRLEISCPGSPRVQCERQDIEEMLGNLIDNAFKWADSQVAVSVAEMSGNGREQVEISVEDDGPGLSPEQCEAAVQRGRRLDETKPGSGLGLSIVADLADLYGGAFHLDRSAMGGLRARVILPSVDPDPSRVPYR